MKPNSCKLDTNKRILTETVKLLISHFLYHLFKSRSVSLRTTDSNICEICRLITWINIPILFFHTRLFFLLKATKSSHNYRYQKNHSENNQSRHSKFFSQVFNRNPEIFASYDKTRMNRRNYISKKDADINQRKNKRCNCLCSRQINGYYYRNRQLNSSCCNPE